MRRYCLAMVPVVVAALVGVSSLNAEPKGSIKSPYRFAYTAGVDANGNLKVLDARGKQLPVKKVDGPLSAKNIVKIRTMTIVEVEGSHYLAIELDGVAYQIPLPD